MTTWRRVLLLALALQLLWLGLQVRRAFGMWRADRILKSVESSTMQAVADRRAPAARLLHNVALLTEVEGLAPASASMRLAKGSQYLLLGRNEAAIQAYREALRLEPRPEIFLNLGRAQWRAGLESEALESFGVAARLDPNLLHKMPPAAAALLE
jgi:tetratricopeptide (TPR) repeat protein